MSEVAAIFGVVIDVHLLEGMRTAAFRAALDVMGDAAMADRVAHDAVAQLILRGIADLADPVAQAAACGASEARVAARESGRAA